ncbi:MAG: biosynthetic arginine decarboxylase [Gammaproteobacteria bacterium]|nr:biosynthetic arginine decarboxylase [Gammaproteobacteria bacterium]
MTLTKTTAAATWSVDDAAEHYRVDAWSDGFFTVNESGHMAVRPFDEGSLSIDIMDIVAELRSRGVRFPAVLRFQDVLRARVKRINLAFAEAIRESGYKSTYQAIYPIKVNQLHEVVEEVLDAGKPYGLGLECGSKAELVATVAHLESDETLLICNGVKDKSMLSLILSTQRLGKNVIPVMEKFAEFEELISIADATEVATQFGVRVRLRTAGAGKWAESGGYQSKFGISLPELMKIVDALKANQAEHQFTLLHFHLGSQISQISQLRQAAKELTQIYAELINMGLPIRYIDVGGGLGVNYTGAFEEGSIQYGLQEYANAVVTAIQDACDARKVAHPILLSESGRAMTAHHSVLVVETLGAFRKATADSTQALPSDSHRLARNLDEILRWLGKTTVENTDIDELAEAYHSVVEIHQEASTLFAMGYLPLSQNALIERMYWSSCSAILRLMRASEPDPLPPIFHELEKLLVDQYLIDFSVFQSALDHWAIQQPFPIVPLDRLDERPTRRALLVDLTCDSDGKISQYVSANEDKNFLELHELIKGEPYYLGFFLMGAYQDIMGDAHNLFGRVAEAHIYGDAEEDGNFWIEKVIPGTKVQDMLAQVQYFPNDLQRRMQNIVKEKIDSGAIRPKRGMAILDQYRACFEDDTYLVSNRVAKDLHGE